MWTRKLEHSRPMIFVAKNANIIPATRTQDCETGHDTIRPQRLKTASALGSMLPCTNCISTV